MTRGEAQLLVQRACAAKQDQYLNDPQAVREGAVRGFVSGVECGAWAAFRALCDAGAFDDGRNHMDRVSK